MRTAVDPKRKMDVMMNMTTEDVRVLREQFSGKLSLEQFVVLLKKTLHDRIHSEVRSPWHTCSAMRTD